GADGVMVVMPYYNKPSQDGLREHVVAVARAVSCPIVLYNIPGRSVIDLGADATARICEAAPNVVGLKAAPGNVLRRQALKRRRRQDEPRRAPPARARQRGAAQAARRGHRPPRVLLPEGALSEDRHPRRRRAHGPERAPPRRVRGRERRGRDRVAALEEPGPR